MTEDKIKKLQELFIRLKNAHILNMKLELTPDEEELMKEYYSNHWCGVCRTQCNKEDK